MADTADRLWTELSDEEDDIVDEAEIKRRLEERIQRRKEEAERMSSGAILKRTTTEGKGYYGSGRRGCYDKRGSALGSGVSSKSRSARGKHGMNPTVYNYGLADLGSPSSTCSTRCPGTGLSRSITASSATPSFKAAFRSLELYYGSDYASAKYSGDEESPTAADTSSESSPCSRKSNDGGVSNSGVSNSDVSRAEECGQGERCTPPLHLDGVQGRSKESAANDDASTEGLALSRRTDSSGVAAGKDSSHERATSCEGGEGANGASSSEEANAPEPRYTGASDMTDCTLGEEIYNQRKDQERKNHERKNEERKNQERMTALKAKGGELERRGPRSIGSCVEADYLAEDGDYVFCQSFDIWYTDPSVVRVRGISKSIYETGCQHVGEFHKLSELNAFHNAIEWSGIPAGSVIAYCKTGVKPQWEDPRNCNGGRFVLNGFPRNAAESLFEKLSLAFVSKAFSDWNNFNLISLHIRNNSKLSDIQFWRCCTSGADTCESVLKGEIKSLLGERDYRTYLTWMPNSGSLKRNDSRLHNNTRKPQRGAAQQTTTSVDSTIADLSKVYSAGPNTLSPSRRQAMIAAADEELLSVTPKGVGIVVPKAFEVDYRATTDPGEINNKATFENGKANQDLDYASEDGGKDVTGWTTVKKGGYCRSFANPVGVEVKSDKPKSRFFALHELLPAEAITSQEGSDNGGPILQAPRQPRRSRDVLSYKNPYPAYDAPVQLGVWQKGRAALNQESAL